MSLSPEIMDLAGRLARIGGLKGPAQAMRNPINWARWLDLAESHRIAPLLAARATENMPDEIREALAQAYVREGRDALLRASELRRVLDAMDGAVEFVALKGAALLDSLYRDLSERTMWDIDLLVQSTADLEKAQALLKARGFTTGKPLAEHHHAPSLKTGFRTLGVELHTNLVTPPLPDGLMEALWTHRTGQTLDPVGLVIHHAIHALNDPMEAPLLRNIFETAWLLNRLTAAQRSDLAAMAARWNIVALLARPLALAQEWFGVSNPFDAPSWSFYEYWCRRRLDWPAELPFSTRVLRHVAHDHIRAMRRGAGGRNIFPIIGILLRWLFPWPGRQSLENHLRRPRGPLNRAAGPAVRVDDCIIFSSTATGEVHLLNADAARVFDDLRGPAAIVRELTRRGVLTFFPGGPPTGPGAQHPS